MKYSRRIILVLSAIFFLFSSKVEAQTSEEVQAHLLQFFESINSKDYDTLYGMLSPSYKKHLPKDVILKMFAMVDENPKFVNQMVEFDLQTLSDPVYYDDIIYFKIDYESVRKLAYTAEASSEYIEKVNEHFRTKHPNSFEYNSTEKMFSTRHPASVILCIEMADEDNLNYYFIPYLPKLRPHMHLLMPKEAADELLGDADEAL